MLRWNMGVIAALVLFSTAAWAQGATSGMDARLALAKQYLFDNGAADAMALAMAGGIEQGIDEQKKAHPEISDAFWTEFRLELKDYIAGHKGELADIVAKYYAEHMTEDELRQVVKFYEDGPGKKLNTLANSEELSKISGAWGEKMGELVGDQTQKKLAGKK